MAACPRCSEENPEHARFCLACGTQLADRAASGEVRKTVTVLFADVKDFTPLGERMDPEAARGVMNRFFGDARSVIERHGGTVEKFIGDAVMAVFGTPTVHEDDPLRAVRAATEMRTELAELNTELEERWGIHLSIRTGINTGKVVAGDPATGSTFVTGDAVNVGARLESAAGPGEILIGDSTYRLVRDAVLVEPIEPLAIKGKTEPMTAWRVLGVVSGAAPVARRLDSPIVGRERELTMLQHAFERAVADKACQLVTILGPAGVGKSRLAAELLSEVDDEAAVLVGRCLPYGEGITFWPVVEIVKRAAGLGPALSAEESRRRIESIVADDPEAEAIIDRLGALLGLWPGPSDTDEIFWAVRRLIQALARSEPVVILFEDVHWGEQTLLDLIDHLSDWARDSPILVMCLARAELLEERPAWGGGKLNATSLLLEPLADEACGMLIENLLDRTEVAGDVKARIARAAEGNPLYVEELVSMLVDDGALQRENGHWVATGDLSSLAIPPTIQALLDARLDRLPLDERSVLERAAIAGRIFSRSAVRVLSPPSEHSSSDDRLAALVRKQLIRPHQAEFGRENMYRFRHSLIRDAAYRQMSKDARGRLHERFARWLESAGEALSAEQEEIIGFHLEQAHRFRSDLGGFDGEADVLGRHGADRLASAGRRALSRGDSSSAVGLLTRAALLLRSDDDARLSTSLELGAALWWNRELERAASVLDHARDQAVVQGDRLRASRAIVDRARVAIDAKEEGCLERAAADAEAALQVFEEARDEAGLARTSSLLAKIEQERCRYEPAADRLERALTHARSAGEARTIEGIITQFQYVLVFGPTPVPDAVQRCREMVEDGQIEPSKRLAAARASMIGYLEAMRGQFEEARALSEASKAFFRDLGLSVYLAAAHWYSALIELLADDSAAAEREIRAALEHAEAKVIHAQFPERSALLAEAVLRQGRTSEAIRHTETSERSASSDDVFTQVSWRHVRARAFAVEGRIDEAGALAAEAVELAAATDSLGMHGEALIALAEVQRLRGEADDSERSAAGAAALFERKGNLVAFERARTFVSDLAHAGP